MPHVEKHAAGEFCWMELATTDQTTAKDFYGSLFGWSAADMPMGPESFYTIFSVNGRHSAAAFTLSPAERERSIPPHWGLYMAVENVDAAAAKAAELGATVREPPFDVFTAGRMAVIQDPTGAIFCAWQAKMNQGIGISGEPGTFCWADLNTRDPERAKQFYSALFGWKIAPGEGKDATGYLHIQNGEKYIGGIPPAGEMDGDIAPHWLIYFLVADVDASAKKALELGAKFLLPPMTIESVGRMAIMADPQGAVSAIFTPGS